ncbi:MAG TPA: Mur ligase family protein [Bryobacteraceae bacterium]|nr:Mur ligase family protein [Bryobacteraceae bacterium]
MRWSRMKLGRRMQELAVSAAAFLWRRLMFRTTFIAITGSAGKGTATACLASILSAHFETNWLPGGRNSLTSQIILRTRFRHRFTVIEAGSDGPGALLRAARFIRPDIVVVLRVLSIHTNVFPTIEDVAMEKAQLMSRLGKRSLAVLNADDPRVLAMADRSIARIRTFGTAAGSFAMADQVSGVWPERLQFRVSCENQSAFVQTNLPGEHLMPSALAAIATAVSCGLSLGQAAAAIKDVQPVIGRMYPLALPNGACIIRDDFNANFPKLIAGLRFLAQARSSRRIVLVGDVLDTGLTVRPRARELGRLVGEAADMAVFLGEEGRLSARAAVEAGMAEASALAYRDLREAADFLRSELRPGDLVLSSGWQGRHIERVSLSQVGEISCWVQRCPKIAPCEMCPELKLVPFPTASHPAARKVV